MWGNKASFFSHSHPTLPKRSVRGGTIHFYGIGMTLDSHFSKECGGQYEVLDMEIHYKIFSKIVVGEPVFLEAANFYSMAGKENSNRSE